MLSNKKSRDGKRLRGHVKRAHSQSNLTSLSKASLFDILDRNTYYPIFTCLCNFLAIGDVVTLTRTCKKFSDLYQYLLPIQWDVDQRLRRFVRDPRRFRSQMAKHNALISGSFVLQYFARVTYEASDLDVFIHIDDDIESFGNYLTSVEGYNHVETKGTERYAAAGVTKVWTSKRQNVGSSESKVQLITTLCQPILAILKGFYSTVIINFMTWNKAYSIFPLPTFCQLKGYLLTELDDYHAGLVAKYSRRGWKIQDIMWPEERNVNHPIQSFRRVGDKYTWVIPFDTRNVEWSKRPDWVLEHACFTMDTDQILDDLYAPDEGWPLTRIIRHYSINARSFYGASLKYEYLLVPGDMIGFLGHRVDRTTLMELRKLDPATRPLNYDSLMENGFGLYDQLHRFDPPEGWTYWDEELLKWYSAWMETEAAKDLLE